MAGNGGGSAEMRKPRLKRDLFLLVLGFVLWLLPALLIIITSKLEAGVTDAELHEVWLEVWAGYKLMLGTAFFFGPSGLYMLISGLNLRSK